MSTTKEGDRPVYTDFRIPRKDDRLAIIRLELPVVEHDMAIFRQWLELLQVCVTANPLESDSSPTQEVNND